LERKKVKVERTKEDCVRYNSGATKIVAATTSLDDESNQSYNSNNRKLG
jgi:hypothetical protein